MALSDTHGHLQPLKQLLNDASRDYDAVIFGGDFTNAIFNPETNSENVYEEIIEFLSQFGPLYYVLGNRDILNPILPQFLDVGARFPIKNYQITADPSLIDNRTIYLTHYSNQIYPNAVLNLDAHTHLALKCGNYINLGFIYRDDSHGAKPLLGGYWEILISENGTIESQFIHSKQIKQVRCPWHPFADYYNPYNRCPHCMFASKEEETKYQQILTALNYKITETPQEISLFSTQEINSNLLLRLQRLNAHKLKEILKQFKIKGFSKLKKDELVEFTVEKLSESELERKLEEFEIEELESRFKKGNKYNEELNDNLELKTTDIEIIGIFQWPDSPEGFHFDSTVCKIQNYKSQNPSFGCTCADARIKHFFCAHLWATLLRSLKTGIFKQEDWHGPFLIRDT